MDSAIRKAQALATKAHAGQARKWTNEPYIEHPRRVVQILRDAGYDTMPEVLVAAWLHDVVEDTETSLTQIRASFGETVGLYVAQLTKPNICSLATTATIKCADIADNVRNIAEVAPAATAMRYLLEKEKQLDTFIELADANVWMLARKRILRGLLKLKEKAA